MVWQKPWFKEAKIRNKLFVAVEKDVRPEFHMTELNASPFSVQIKEWARDGPGRIRRVSLRSIGYHWPNEPSSFAGPRQAQWALLGGPGWAEWVGADHERHMGRKDFLRGIGVQDGQ